MGKADLSWLITDKAIAGYRIIGYQIYWQHRTRQKVFGKGAEAIRGATHPEVARFVLGMNKFTPEVYHWFEPVFRPIRREEP